MLYQLSYSRGPCIVFCDLFIPVVFLPKQYGGGGRTRTYVVERRQIYSLLPLTAWVPLLTCCFSIFLSWRQELNLQPPDYKSGALPIELRQHHSVAERGGL